MDFPLTIEPEINKEVENEDNLADKKEYKLSFNKDIYKLLIEKNSKEKIIFKLRLTNNITRYFYIKEIKYQNLIKILNLNINNYNNIETVIKYLDTSLSDQNVKITQNNNNKCINLCFEKKEIKKCS